MSTGLELGPQIWEKCCLYYRRNPDHRKNETMGKSLSVIERIVGRSKTLLHGALLVTERVQRVEVRRSPYSRVEKERESKASSTDFFQEILGMISRMLSCGFNG